MRLFKALAKMDLIIISFFGLVFFLMDRFFKYQATRGWSSIGSGEYFGWHPYFNRGVGFGLPVPNVITIFLTIIILSLVAFLFLKQVSGVRYKVLGIFSLSLIFLGATSNLIDRILFGYVVDYLFVITGYVNMADIMIVVGFSIYLVESNYKYKITNTK
ncbi:MAG: signal peptidase II [Candidatus Magasanikbacteria bacterium]|jgi:signal peptidase II